jgi:polysaccharide export outer membrane protein
MARRPLWFHRHARLLPVARLLAGVLAACLVPALAGDAWSQTNSDLIAYPKALTDFEVYRQDTKHPRQLTFNRMPGLSPDYQVGPGDELEVVVAGLFADSQKLKVSADGTVTIPYLGPVTVADKTTEEIEQAIAAGLTAKDLINDPQVLVDVSEYEAKTVYVLGEVDRPGEYAVSFQMTLMDLTFIAGGIDFTAANTGYLHRRVSSGAPPWRPTQVQADMRELQSRPGAARQGTEVIEVDLRPMKTGSVLERNITLRNGDVFYVPRRKIEVVYVIGDVVSAGAFELPEEKTLTASKAISWAGGPAKTAKMKNGILMRYEADGTRKELPVDFAAVLRGEQPDVEVRANDIIFLPGSKGKTLGLGFLNSLPNVLAMAIFF